MSTQENNPVSTTCSECTWKGRQIEELSEKLHLAINQKQALLNELERMKKAMKDMQWRIDTRGQPPPSLPVETWQEIFSFATCFEGLSHSPHHGRSNGMAWKENLRTRYNIPLVCRQWNQTGTQFLYGHISLAMSRQVKQVLKVVALHPAFANHIRALEFAPIHFVETARKSFWDLAGDLVGLSPRLQLLGLSHTDHTESHIDDMDRLLEMEFKEMDTLQLIERVNERTGNRFPLTMPKAPKLHTLSFLPETQRFQLSPDRIGSHISPSIYPNLCTLFILLDFANSTLSAEFRSTLQGIRTLSIGVGRRGYIVPPWVGGGDIVHQPWHSIDLEKILDLTPKLTELSLPYNPQVGFIPSHSEGGKTHTALQRVLIHLNNPWDISTLASALKPLFIKIERRELPALQSIQVIGGFTDGCVDAGIFTQPKLLVDWTTANCICEQEGVALLNERDGSLYLWSDAYAFGGFRLGSRTNYSISYTKSSKGRAQDSICTSEDESWTEDSGEMRGASDWEETDQEECEPGDSPYVYKTLRDIRRVDNMDLPENWASSSSDEESDGDEP